MNRFINGLSYRFHRNLGNVDKIIRLLVALIMIGSWYFGFVSGILGTALTILAMMILGTVATSRCGVTYWFDANTMNQKEKNECDRKGISYE